MNRGKRRCGLFLILITLCLLPLAARGQIAINEIAWAGSSADPADEWIELVNASDAPVDLTGWRLISSDGAPAVTLTGTLFPRDVGDAKAGYFLLERSDDSSVPARAANAIYTGALTNAGETLYLYDSEGRLVDTANVPPVNADGSPKWPGGNAAPAYCSMERIDPLVPDVTSNWASCSCAPSEVASALCCGSPGRKNTAYNVSPTPRMTIAPRYPHPGELVLFGAAGSTDGSNAIVSYTWSLGDGTVEIGQTVSHTYSAPGSFEVVLTLLDSKGGSASLSEALYVHSLTPPLADFSVISSDELPLRAGEPISFCDESSDGLPGLSERHWDLGDGESAEGACITHEFASAGTYNVCLTVTDARGSNAQRCEPIEIASRIPAASLTIQPELPSSGELVLFDASASVDPDGEIVLFHWDFDGDETVDKTSVEPTAEHVFEQAGYVAPRVTVEDADGDRSAPYGLSLYVNAAPAAQFTVSAFAPDEMQEVQFVDCSYDDDGTIQSWQWDFGDGKTSIQTAPAHAFRCAGRYTVRLTVVDNQEASAVASATIDVTNLPPAARLETGCVDQQTGVTFTFDASASSDPSPEGSIVRYEWDLDGDGVFDRETTAASASQSYEDDGARSVSVRVTDNAGSSTVSDPIRIAVRNRPPRISRVDWDPADPADGREILFFAQADDPDGEITGWSWRFGEAGTSAAPEPIHAFGDDGLYEVSLAVCDDDGATSEPFLAQIAVANAAPIASLSVSHEAPRTIAFSAASSWDPSPTGRIVHIAWDFGDGTACPEDLSSCGSGNRTAPVHEYANPGTYFVTLVVIDNEGAIGESTRSVTIRE